MDFEGYIDKFYSTDIFLMSNEEALKFYIESGPMAAANNRGFTMFLRYVLTSLVAVGELSVRKIIKHKYDFSVKEFVLAKQEGLTPMNMDSSVYNRFMASYKDLRVDSSDLPILEFFKLMAIVYGEFGEFYQRFKKMTVALSKKQIDYNAEDLKDLLEFMALQKHIATNVGDALFFKLSHGRDWNEEVALKEIAPPQVALSSITYDIDLKWSHNNIYTGQESYFKDSKAANSDRRQYIGSQPQTSVSANEIFKAIDEIIHACQERNYLRLAGIIFNND